MNEHTSERGTSMPPCSEPGCVGLAGPNGQCVAHSQGYRRHSGSHDIHCENCRKVIRKDEWYRAVGGLIQHTKPCATHPDVIKERAAAVSTNAASEPRGAS